MTAAGRHRLALYIIIGTLPELISWLTLTFDWTPRGVSIIAAKMLLAAAVNWRAFIDSSGKAEPVVTVNPEPDAPAPRP